VNAKLSTIWHHKNHQRLTMMPETSGMTVIVF